MMRTSATATAFRRTVSFSFLGAASRRMASAVCNVCLIQTRFSIADARTQTFRITRALAVPDADVLKVQLWSPSRLSRKLAVFTSVTAPCVLAQTHKHWEWRIYTSADIPCMAALRTLASSDPRISIVVVESTPEALVADADAWLTEASAWKDGRAALGTMRLDDDDGLPPTALQEANALLAGADAPPFAGFRALHALVLSDAVPPAVSVSREREFERRFVLASGLTALRGNVHAAGSHATLADRARVVTFDAPILQTSDPASCDTARKSRHGAESFAPLRLDAWLRAGTV